jgi:hypothetical protein
MGARKPHRTSMDSTGPTGRQGTFRLQGAARRDPSVDVWLAEGSVGLRSIAQKWFAQMRQCGDDVRELMHDGCPVACVNDAAFAYVNTFKTHVNVGFFHGASLSDPAGLLEGSGRRMRHVKMHPDVRLNEPAISRLIDAAYLDIRIRLDVEQSGAENDIAAAKDVRLRNR